MTRAHITAAVEASVLTRSRRRCCICFALNRDTALKSGQIAHLDYKSSKSNETNLAFLCFIHHDEYDSVSSQRKGFTINEVKAYREELYGALGSVLNQAVHFGEVQIPPADPYAGKYTLVDKTMDSAEVVITPIPDTIIGEPRYFVSGKAFAGINREFGPNMGEVSFVAVMDREGELAWVRANGETCAFTNLRFVGDGKLEIEETNIFGQYGWGVTFAGTYSRGH